MSRADNSRPQSRPHQGNTLVGVFPWPRHRRADRRCAGLVFLPSLRIPAGFRSRACPSPPRAERTVLPRSTCPASLATSRLCERPRRSRSPARRPPPSRQPARRSSISTTSCPRAIRLRCRFRRQGKTDAAPDKFFLQLGAFADPSEADNVKARLALIGLEASVQRLETADKGTLHRVRLGPYLKPEDMNTVRAQLAQAGIDSSVVRTRSKASPAQSAPR